jgi:hypothetical protein
MGGDDVDVERVTKLLETALNKCDFDWRDEESARDAARRALGDEGGNWRFRLFHNPNAPSGWSPYIEAYLPADAP